MKFYRWQSCTKYSLKGWVAVNQDFREVTKMFDRSCVEIELYEFETGPSTKRDIRVKNKYVSSN